MSLQCIHLYTCMTCFWYNWILIIWRSMKCLGNVEILSWHIRMIQKQKRHDIRLIFSHRIEIHKNETTSISNTNKTTWCLPFLKRPWMHRSFSYTTQKKKRQCKIQHNIYLEYFHFSRQHIYWTKIIIIVSIDLCNLTMWISFSKRTKKKKP